MFFSSNVLKCHFVFAGVFIGISPLYVLGQGILTVPDGIAGELFCRLIDNSFFVWAFVKFSVAIVTCMAIERWFAIARPLQHNIHFTRTRTLVYVGLTLLAVCILSSILFFEKQLAFKDSTPVCVWRALISGTAANQVFTVLYCTVTAFLPLFITMATFGYLYTVLSRPAPPIRNVQARTNRKRAEVRLCFMSALVAICLAVCFVPNQVSYILSKFGITKLGSPGHHFTVVLSLFNSCINPFVYCLSNRSYRREFLLLICPCKANAVVPIVTDNSNSGRVGPQTLRSTNEGVIPGPTLSTQC